MHKIDLKISKMLLATSVAASLAVGQVAMGAEVNSTSAAQKQPAQVTAAVQRAGRDAGDPGADQRAGHGPNVVLSASEQALIEATAPKFVQKVYKDARTGIALNYSLYVPAHFNPGTKYPMVMYIPDATGAGKTAQEVVEQYYGANVWASDAFQKKHEAIVVVPAFSEVVVNDKNQTSREIDVAVRLINSLTRQYPIDTDRLYTTGQSMGCMTSLFINSKYPDLFAASVYVSGQWDINVLKPLEKQKFFYIVAGGDAKASAGQNEVKAMFDTDEIPYSQGTWSARDALTAQNQQVQALIDQKHKANMVTFETGTVLNGQSDMEHMASFNYAYALTSVQDWLFAQNKQEKYEEDLLAEQKAEEEALLAAQKAEEEKTLQAAAGENAENGNAVSSEATTAQEGEAVEADKPAVVKKRMIALPHKQYGELNAALNAMVGQEGTQVPGVGVIAYKDGSEIYSHFAGVSYIAPALPETEAAEEGTTEQAAETKTDAMKEVAVDQTADADKLEAVQTAEDEEAAEEEQPKVKSYPMRRTNSFRIGQLSEQFTVYSMMRLVENGKLDLDEDVSKYLGFTLRNPAYPDTPITLRMLASHTSSLRDGANDALPMGKSIQELFTATSPYWQNGAHFAKAGQEPGKYFTQSKLNYGLLATIIEKVTGSRFDKYQDKLFDLLDIRASYVPNNLLLGEWENIGTIYQKKDHAGNWNESGEWIAQVDDKYALVDKKDKTTLPKSETINLNTFDGEGNPQTISLKGYKPGTNAMIFDPAGGLRISAVELTHVLKMLFHDGVYNEERVLSADSLQTMFAPQWTYDEALHNGDTAKGKLLSYGLGVTQISGTAINRLLQNRDVNFAGALSSDLGLHAGLLWAPGTQDGIIFVTNGEAIDAATDTRSAGTFSANDIWDETIVNTVGDVVWGLDDEESATSK